MKLLLIALFLSLSACSSLSYKDRVDAFIDDARDTVSEARAKIDKIEDAIDDADAANSALNE